MLKNGKYYLIWIATMLIVLFCIIGTLNAQEQETVKFGLVTWTEGSALEAGRSYAMGFNTAIKYINDNGGILGGRKVEGFIGSQGETGETARQGALRLIRQNDVKALIGPNWEVMAPAGLQAAKEFNVVFAPDQGGLWLYQQGYPGTLGLAIGNAGSRTAAQIRWIEEKGFKTVVKLYADIPYCHTVDDLIIERWDKPDSPVKVLDKIWYPFGKIELSKELSAAIALNPDFIWIQEHSRVTAVSAIRTLYELGYTGSFSVCQFLNNEAIAGLPSEATEKLYSYLDYFPNKDDPNVQPFIKYWQEVNGENSLPWGQEEVAFTHTLYVAQAMDRAGTEGDNTIENLKKINAAMHEIYKEGPILSRGVKVNFSEEGIGLWPHGYMTEVKNGKFVLESLTPLNADDYFGRIK